MGIGRDESLPLADFVLSKIKDKQLYDDIIEKAAEMVLEKIC